MNRKNIPVLKTLFVKFKLDYKDSYKKEEFITSFTVNWNIIEVPKVISHINRYMKNELGHDRFDIEIVSMNLL